MKYKVLCNGKVVLSLVSTKDLSPFDAGGVIRIQKQPYQVLYVIESKESTDNGYTILVTEVTEDEVQNINRRLLGS